MNSAHYLIKRLPLRVVLERDNPAWVRSECSDITYAEQLYTLPLLVTNFWIFTVQEQVGIENAYTQCIA